MSRDHHNVSDEVARHSAVELLKTTKAAIVLAIDDSHPDQLRMLRVGFPDEDAAGDAICAAALAMSGVLSLFEAPE